MVYVHGEKFWTAQRQLETLFIHVTVSQSLVPNQIFCRKKHSVAKKWSWENCLHVLSLPNSGNSSTSEVSCPPDLADKKASYNGLDAVGPCMCLSVHVPNVYRKVVFTWLLTWKHLKTTRSISHGSEYCLCIGVDAYFYGWCNPNPDLGIGSEEMAQLKNLCPVLSGLQIPILPTGQILDLGK